MSRKRGQPHRLSEGKTKIVWQSALNPNNVHIRSKDAITAGDGVRKAILENKGVYSTQTTCNCFELLKKYGIPNHLLKRVDGTTFLARRLVMIPFEVVNRRIAYGSFLKRIPNVPEKFRFDEPTIEFFLKNDALHDPLIRFEPDALETEPRWTLFNPKTPLSDEGSVIGTFPRGHFKFSGQDWTRTVDLAEVEKMASTSVRVFKLLEREWLDKWNVVLVDLKTEFGFDYETGELMVGDVIDNDSWRIWPNGDESMMLDKERFRKLENPTPEELEKIRRDYELVATYSNHFPQ